MLAPIFDGDKPAIEVVNATERFIAQGGSWIPTALLRNQIERTALGRLDRSEFELRQLSGMKRDCGAQPQWSFFKLSNFDGHRTGTNAKRPHLVGVLIK